MMARKVWTAPGFRDMVVLSVGVVLSGEGVGGRPFVCKEPEVLRVAGSWKPFMTFAKTRPGFLRQSSMTNVVNEQL